MKSKLSNIIDKNSRIPLYYQLMDIIINMIDSGNLKENDKLPSERELCDKYDISRSTVRQAIQELEMEGYLYKIQGKGTFVSEKRFEQDLLKLYSFTDEMENIGKIPKSKVLDFELIQANEKISQKMKLKDKRVYAFTRIRLADDEPMILETTYVPYTKVTGLEKNMLEKTPMYDIFRDEYDINIESARETFTAVLTRKDEAEKLDYQENMPSLMIERIAYDDRDVIEYTKSIARGDKFKYIVNLNK